MIYYIYKLKCKNSDDVYIGRTSNIKTRIYNHEIMLKSSNKKLYKIIRDNGGFDCEILEETHDCDKSKELERYHYETLKPSLNKNYPYRNHYEYYKQRYLDNKNEVSNTRKEYYKKNQERLKINTMNRYIKKKQMQTIINYGDIIVNFD